MHPGAWLIWALSASLVAIATTNPFYLVPLFAAVVLVYAARRGPALATTSFRVFLLFGAIALVTRTVLVVFGSVTKESIAAAFLEGLRLAVLLSVYGALNSVSDPYRFLRLAPRRFHEPALAAALALSIAPRTIEAVGRVKEAQRLRGIQLSRWRALPALAVPVLETGLEEAVTLAESMDARGHGRGGRTRYRPQHWTVTSSIGSAAALAAVATFAVFGSAESVELTVSTHPLHWPTASTVLIVGVLLLAAPALLPKEKT
ncbi:MAG: energy-coupling factor transporter transmembrane protein EcfT [Actinomycetota bacterium]|nr:energy-coupling factor transporter transmembrane protein EcfT [Actinomycetota bacterium]